jgi:glycosyltransferase involved in cell wall biosynthesis
MDTRSLRGYRLRLLAKADAVFSLATSISSSLISHGIKPERVHLVPNAIDIPDVDERSNSHEAQLLPQQGCSMRIVIPAVLNNNKNQATAIRACGRLVAQGYDLVLWLVGDVSYAEVNPYLLHLQQEAASCGMSARTMFLGWREDIPALIKAASVVALPSRSEGVARVLLESMALRRPTISTPVGGTPDLLIPGQTGWLHEPDDDEALAKCIIEAHDPAKRDLVVSRAYEHVKMHFSPVRQRELAYAAFEAVVNRNRKTLT